VQSTMMPPDGSGGIMMSGRRELGLPGRDVRSQ
jgi:hypothetical protein